ncbi:hypothetical protein GCM10017690_22270 [Microbacterium terregens]
MNLQRDLRLTYDHAHGAVYLNVERRRRRGRNRGRYHAPLERIARGDLRALCDLLHDYADQLDRHDRELGAASPRGKGVHASTTPAQRHPPRSESSLPGGGTPSRAHAREAVARG